MMIPDSEIIVEAARSGGPGGQAVNKKSTKIVLRWHVGRSAAFTDEEKARLRERLSSRLTDEDEIVLHCDEQRSQIQNREACVARLFDIVGQALFVAKKRVATRPSRSSRAARMDSKTKEKRKKANRRSLE